ncbi:UreD urease accessory protein-domain-containing protein [Chytridium lagenaria]|nr:UreD urease accessory protein-domain-containing protein [Chytridium lagenaria]
MTVEASPIDADPTDADPPAIQLKGPQRIGSGVIDLAPSNATETQCSFSHLAFTFPLRLISPSPHPSAPLHRSVYMLSYGGGLLANDEISLKVRVKGKCSLSILTQGTTKVFKIPSTSSQTSRQAAAKQHLTIRIGSESLICILPDPVVPFADSSFSQTQTIYLDSVSSSLVLLDWVSAGRVSRGEAWDFKRYESRVSVRLGTRDGPELFRDVWLLEDDETDNSPHRSFLARVRPYKCLATLLLLGPRASSLAISARKAFEKVKVSKQRPGQMQEVIWSLSPVQHFSASDYVEVDEGKVFGVVVRIAGMGALEVREFVKERLVGLEDEIGEDLFSKHV